jgi:predicted DNA-binding ribbon-helix-helix protein
MRTTIELPDPFYRKGEQIARTQGVTIEEFIVRAFERELKDEPDLAPQARRVTLPLVPSNEPGTLDLKDFNFDDLLA